VTAFGTALSYQWRLNGADLAGATTSALTLTNVQTSDAGAYSVIDFQQCRTVISSDAILTVVTVPPSINRPAA